MRDNPNRFKMISQRIYLAVLAVLLLLGLWNEHTMIPAAVLIILTVVGYLVLLLFFWRCPYCGQNFPIRAEGNFSYCPHCGQPLPPPDSKTS